MPHKKNPDVFELIRAKSNKLSALPLEISLITTNLSTGYHRDLQIIKESFIPSINTILDCIKLCKYSLEKIEVNNGCLLDDKYKYLFSVESVNQLVLDGFSFREAYKMVSEQIESNHWELKTTDITWTHEGSIGNLCNDEIVEEWKNVYSRFDFDKVDKSLSMLIKNDFLD
jgi:argininosuccinate lyase